MQFSRSQNKYSLGVELEFQIINPSTLDLFPQSPLILKHLKGQTNQVKAELFQSMIEVNSRPHTDLNNLEDDLIEQVALLNKVSSKLDFAIAGTGTHPFACYEERIPYPHKRYTRLIETRQFIARRLQIFGMHIHIGCISKSHLIELNNFMIHYLPLLQALSVSSPFWRGMNTGLQSSRSTIFESMPTAGHPEIFANWAEFEKTLNMMISTKSISGPKDIWWDLRPNLEFGTLEIRVFDGVNRIQDIMGIVFFVRSLCNLFEFFKVNKTTVPFPANWVWRENKWRACRYGIKAKLIYPDLKQMECKAAIKKTLEIIKKNTDSHHKRFEGHLNSLLTSTSADRQLKVYKQTGDLKKVAAFNISEFHQSFGQQFE